MVAGATKRKRMSLKKKKKKKQKDLCKIPWVGLIWKNRPWKGIHREKGE